MDSVCIKVSLVFPVVFEFMFVGFQIGQHVLLVVCDDVGSEGFG